MLISTLGHIGDPRRDGDEVGLQVTGHLKDALPPGGCLAVGDLIAHPDLNTALDWYNATGAAPYRARSPEQFTRLFDGLDIIGPPAGPASQWQPEPSPFTVRDLPAWGGVGRKPRSVPGPDQRSRPDRGAAAWRPSGPASEGTCDDRCTL